ncbi:MAG TPA: TadE/TadG family type IV pilus assembly protein [Pirellulales bacterium]|nr:TadE/TadG family type IV pilus assembly protein [Pirellulales bacterium]
MRYRTNRERRGAAAVELAVMAPLLAFLFAVSVDFARVFYVAQTIENCARNGAMYASDPKAPANNLYTSVQNAALANAGSLQPTPTVTSSTGTDSGGNPYVTVTVSYPFKTYLNILGVSSYTLTRTVQARSAN